MSAVDCAALRDAIEPLAAGDAATPDQHAHLAECASCQARVALALRLERVLAEWPVPVPGPALAQRVLATTRQEAWQREQVVDWGFNVAIATGLVAIVVGLVAMVWVLGSAAGPGATAEVMTDLAAALVTRMRAQVAVVATASLLLTATLVAWWWAEERG